MSNNVNETFDFTKFFAEIKTIAVVGYSDKPERAGYFVAHYMADHGYQVVGVNPKLVPEHNGIKVYSSLGDIPATLTIDVIDVFRAPPIVPGIVELAARMQPRPGYFFFQPGTQSDEGIQAAQNSGMIPIIDSCMMAAHKKLT